MLLSLAFVNTYYRCREVQEIDSGAQVPLCQAQTAGTDSSASKTCWWQPSEPPLLASGKQAGSKKQIPLTDEQLRRLTPCGVVRNALPPKLANQLLQLLLGDSAMWNRGTWYIFGKKHDAPRTSSYYTLHKTNVRDQVCSLATETHLLHSGCIISFSCMHAE